MEKNILSKEEMEKRAKIKEYGFILLPVNTEIWEDFTPEQTGMLLSAVSNELLDIGFHVDIPPGAGRILSVAYQNGGECAL